MNNLVEESLKHLKEKKIPNPELDLRILLKHASYNNKNIYLSNLNIQDINIKYFNELFLMRLKNKPISKIINTKYFWKSKFFVNNHVLDPRPETEIIIEEVLRIIKNKDKNLKILDIGTGSGCIAISLAQEFKNSIITAIDISEKALSVAKKNVFLNNLSSQIILKNIDFEQLDEKFDIIVSNPPYLNEKEYKNLDTNIKKNEPKIAFFGGRDGLKFYRKFAKKIHKNLNSKSYFIFEVGIGQSNSCKTLFENTNLRLVNVSKDLQKIERTLTFFNI